MQNDNAPRPTKPAVLRARARKADAAKPAPQALALNTGHALDCPCADCSVERRARMALTRAAFRGL